MKILKMCGLFNPIPVHDDPRRQRSVEMVVLPQSLGDGGAHQILQLLLWRRVDLRLGPDNKLLDMETRFEIGLSSIQYLHELSEGAVHAGHNCSD